MNRALFFGARGLGHAALLLLALGITHRTASATERAKERDLPTPTVPEIEKDRPPPGSKKKKKKRRPPSTKANDERETPAATDTASEEEEEEEEEDDGAGRVIVPLVMYSPETHLGLGGLLVQFFRIGDSPKDSRVSSVAFVALVTTRRQAIFEIIPDLYWDDEADHVSGKLEYQRFPDSFWGIGPRTPDANEERYERERLRFRGGPQRRVVGPLYAGLYTDVMEFAAEYPDPNGVFATTDVPGEEGGFTAGVGPTASFDTRDNTVASRSGTLLTATWIWFDGLIGSEYDFWKLITEARQFFPIGEESALGFRYYGEFQSGTVPYYHLAMLGGDELLRGYFLGRYRDKHLVALEGEYRFPLFWRLGAVAFAGAGEVADKLTDLDAEPIRWAGGGGLRLALNTKERLNLRLDVGAGPDTFGVYFTAREAF